MSIEGLELCYILLNMPQGLTPANIDPQIKANLSNGRHAAALISSFNHLYHHIITKPSMMNGPMTFQSSLSVMTLSVLSISPESNQSVISSLCPFRLQKQWSNEYGKDGNNDAFSSFTKSGLEGIFRAAESFGQVRKLNSSWSSMKDDLCG